MPARRKTHRELLLSGGIKEHAGRYTERGDVPQAGPLGDPPAHLSVAAKKIWYEISSAAPEGLLQSADRLLLEIACKLVSRLRNRRAPAENKEINLLTTVLSKLGLTPADRQRIDIKPISKPPDTNDPWAEVLGDHSWKGPGSQ